MAERDAKCSSLIKISNAHRLSGAKLRRWNMVKVTKFDTVQYLDSEEMVAAYLEAALEDQNPDVFLAALADVAKARGIAQLSSPKLNMEP